MNTALSDFAEKATAVAVIETEQAFVDEPTLFINNCDGLWATSSFCLDEVPTDDGSGDGDGTETVTDDGDAADSGDAGDSGTTDGGDTVDSGTTDGGDAGDGGDTGDTGDDNAADAGDGTG